MPCYFLFRALDLVFPDDNNINIEDLVLCNFKMNALDCPKDYILLR